MLLPTPANVEARFEEALTAAGVAANHRPHFLRWLRFFLDFCRKYKLDSCVESSLEAFGLKLESKGQEAWKRHQAAEAIRLYWLMLDSRCDPGHKKVAASVGLKRELEEVSRPIAESAEAGADQTAQRPPASAPRPELKPRY